MESSKQKIKGNNNIQIGINNGDIIHTQKIINRTNAIPNPEIHISEEQAFAIQQRVNDLVDLICKTKGFERNKAYIEVYGGLKHYFRVTGYKFLPKDKFEDAIQYLDRLKVLKYRPKLRTLDNEEYRKQYYKSIHAKANELNFSHEELYQFINDYLKPKKVITSLKELSDTRLKKIYTKLFSMR